MNLKQNNTWALTREISIWIEFEHSKIIPYLRAPSRLRVVPHFSSGIAERVKRKRAWKNFLSPRRVSPFLAWGDFHARSTIPEEKWGTTRILRANILSSIYTVYK